MATSADAETALAKIVSDALAPLNVVTKTVRGWPAPNALEAEMRSGSVIASVYRLEVSRNTTRYLGEQAGYSVAPPTLTATVTNGTATFGGTANIGQVAGIIAKGIAYPVRLVAGDTPTSVAAKVAALLPGATSSGATVTAVGLSDARTAADGTALRELGRQENTLQVDLWCPNPVLRDQAEALVLPAVAASAFLVMPDGSRARVRLGSVLASDETSPLTIYRLMLRVTAEITLSANEAATIALWPISAVNGVAKEA